MTTHKALILSGEKQPFTLVSDWPTPKPGPKEVLVKLEAIALNPADWKIQQGLAPALVSSYPFICGLDGAGVIVEVGSEVANLVKGDKVYVITVIEPYHDRMSTIMFQHHLQTHGRRLRYEARDIPTVRSFSRCIHWQGLSGL